MKDRFPEILGHMSDELGHITGSVYSVMISKGEVQLLDTIHINGVEFVIFHYLPSSSHSVIRHTFLGRRMPSREESFDTNAPDDYLFPILILNSNYSVETCAISARYQTTDRSTMMDPACSLAGGILISMNRVCELQARLIRGNLKEKALQAINDKRLPQELYDANLKDFLKGPDEPSRLLDSQLEFRSIQVKLLDSTPLSKQYIFPMCNSSHLLNSLLHKGLLTDKKKVVCHTDASISILKSVAKFLFEDPNVYVKFVYQSALAELRIRLSEEEYERVLFSEDCILYELITTPRREFTKLHQTVFMLPVGTLTNIFFNNIATSNSTGRHFISL